MFRRPPRRPTPPRPGLSGPGLPLAAPAGSPRGAFTMIELLVVVAVISILLGLTVTATLAFVTSAREAATRATLTKIDGRLERRLAGLRRSLESGAGDASRVGGGVVGALSVKQRQLRWMPQYAALENPGDERPLTEDRDVLGRARNGGAAVAPFNAADFATDPTASSEALYLFLTRGESFGVEDVAAEDFTESELADTDGDGLREIVDGFGNPIRFYRWPTRLLRPAPDADANGVIDLTEAAAQQAAGRYPLAAYASNPQLAEASAAAAALLGKEFPSREFTPYGAAIAADADPADPFLPTLGSRLRADPDDRFAQIGGPGGEFDQSFPRLARSSGSYDAATAGQNFEQYFHTPATYFTPLVVSAGADGELGLYEPQDRDRFGHLAQPSEPAAALDNLTNAQGGF